MSFFYIFYILYIFFCTMYSLVEHKINNLNKRTERHEHKTNTGRFQDMGSPQPVHNARGLELVLTARLVEK